MTDNISEAPIVDVAPIAAPIAAPAVESAPIIDTPAPLEAPVVDAPVSVPEVENILGDVDSPKVDVEVKKEGEVTPAEIPVETPTEVILPTYEEFKLPENYNADKESIGEFSKLLGELEVASGKMDHAAYQEAGQKLIDLGTKNVQASIEKLNQYYENFHEKQKKDWFESFKNDPDFGGDKLQETVSTLRSSIEQYGGTPEQISEFRQIMKDTGVGNHPAVTRVLYNMQQKINKYETESDNGNGGSNRIIPGAKPAPTKVKPYQQFYGNGN